MKARGFHACIVNTKQLTNGISRNTYNQSMKVRNIHAHIVNTKQLQKEAYKDTWSQFIFMFENHQMWHACLLYTLQSPDPRQWPHSYAYGEPRLGSSAINCAGCHLLSPPWNVSTVTLLGFYTFDEALCAQHHDVRSKENEIYLNNVGKEDSTILAISLAISRISKQNLIII